MKTKRAAKTLLFFVAALALSACSERRQEPAPKTAETEEVKSMEEAKSLFLKDIEWDNHPNARVTLYNDLLSRNDSLGELRSKKMYHANEYLWFAYIDYQPGAYFRHPTAYALLTYEKPRISIYSRSNLPTLNYKPVWEDTAALFADENVIYDKSWTEHAPFRDTASILADQPQNWPPRMATDTCKNEKRAYALLIHNLEDLSQSPETQDNLDSMATALAANGYNVQEFVFDKTTGEKRPYLDLSAPKGGGIYQLMNFINIHVDFNDCCEELLVYITGETDIEKTDYQETVYLDIPFAYAGKDRSRKPELRLYPEDLASIFDELKTCHLNFIIDSNNAGGFTRDLLRIPSTESVLSACQNYEYTYSSSVETLGNGRFEDAYGARQGEKGSEFTSSVAKALFENAVTRREEAPPDPAVTLVKAAFESVKRFDISYHGGKTTPRLEGRTMDSDCPCATEEQLTQY